MGVAHTLHNMFRTMIKSLRPVSTFSQFFIVMNVAVGGTGYFPDDATNPGGKPWSNQSPTVSS